MLICGTSQKTFKVHGIKNYGYNCYINSGLQILSKIEKLTEKIKSYSGKSELLNSLKNAFEFLNKSDEYKKSLDPRDFMEKYLSYNNELKKSQNCSQSFIRKLIYNINNELTKEKPGNNIDLKYLYTIDQRTYEYQFFLQYIKREKILEQSQIFCMFSIITKSLINDDCPFCRNNINQIAYNQFLDQILYLDAFENKKKISFLNLLYENIGKNMNLTMNCTYCNKEIKVKEITKIVKLPEIIIFTIERFIRGINDIKITNEKKINMKNYLDDLVKEKYKNEVEYKLFAINIRYGGHYGHQICQIILNDNNIYEINDSEFGKIKEADLEEKYSYGLFYKRIYK
jgi:ubiquitin C-terminal hydrolase